MPHAEGFIDIKKPVQGVFAFLVDGMNNPKWREGILDIQLAAGTLGAVGARYTQGMKGPMGRISADYELVEVVPNQKIRFQVTAGPARPEGLYTLADNGQGGTHLTFSLHWEPKGFIAKLFLAPMVAKQMPKEIEALKKLKTVLENSTRS